MSCLTLHLEPHKLIGDLICQVAFDLEIDDVSLKLHFFWPLLAEVFSDGFLAAQHLCVLDEVGGIFGTNAQDFLDIQTVVSVRHCINRASKLFHFAFLDLGLGEQTRSG